MASATRDLPAVPASSSAPAMSDRSSGWATRSSSARGRTVSRISESALARRPGSSSPFRGRRSRRRSSFTTGGTTWLVTNGGFSRTPLGGQPAVACNAPRASGSGSSGWGRVPAPQGLSTRIRRSAIPNRAPNPRGGHSGRTRPRAMERLLRFPVDLAFKARNAHPPLSPCFEHPGQPPGGGQAIGGAHADVKPACGPLNGPDVVWPC